MHAAAVGDFDDHDSMQMSAVLLHLFKALQVATEQFRKRSAADRVSFAARHFPAVGFTSARDFLAKSLKA